MTVAAYGAWICLVAPLAAALLITLLGTGISRRAAAYVATTSVLGAFAAALFAIGAAGVLLRRSLLIVLLSLEIMLNGANLALIAFSRHHGEASGQIFALAVMAVAASEVVVGLGLIVALNRKRVPLDVDRLSSLRG